MRTIRLLACAVGVVALVFCVDGTGAAAVAKPKPKPHPPVKIVKPPTVQMFADVAVDGALGAHVGAVSSVRHSSGLGTYYVVTFDRTIGRCAASARVGEPKLGDTLTALPTTVTQFGPTSFEVDMLSNLGTGAIDPFMLTVTCQTPAAKNTIISNQASTSVLYADVDAEGDLGSNYGATGAILTQVMAAGPMYTVKFNQPIGSCAAVVQVGRASGLEAVTQVPLPAVFNNADDPDSFDFYLATRSGSRGTEPTMITLTCPNDPVSPPPHAKIAQPATTVRYANVDESGDLGSNVGASGVTQTKHDDVDFYNVQFAKPITGCSAIVQPGRAGGPNLVEPAASVAGVASPTLLDVTFDDVNGTEMDDAFLLEVTCPN